MVVGAAEPLCQTCGRPLGKHDDPLSLDCGGDCWGCVGEAKMGYEPSMIKVTNEIESRLRKSDGSAKKWVS